MDFGQSTKSRLTTPLSVPRVDTDAVAKMKSPHNIDWLSNLLLHPRRKAGNMLIMANYISDIWHNIFIQKFSKYKNGCMSVFSLFSCCSFPSFTYLWKKGSGNIELQQSSQLTGYQEHVIVDTNCTRDYQS